MTGLSSPLTVLGHKARMHSEKQAIGENVQNGRGRNGSASGPGEKKKAGPVAALPFFRSGAC